MLTGNDLDRIAGFQTIDITTTGRRSGQPRRIEIWWFRYEHRFIISGTPGKRDWLANLRARPQLTVHVDGMNLTATAAEIADENFRRAFFQDRSTRWYSTQVQLERLVAEAPMVEVLFD